jgi:hypothetical protein
LNAKDRSAMPLLQVSTVLPYYLRLQEGDYPTAPTGEVVHVEAPLLLEGIPPRTPISAQFAHEDTANLNEILRRRDRDVDQLLQRINKLLRWYRCISRRAEITELTIAQGSPVTFLAVEGAAAPEWLLPFAIVAPVLPAAELPPDQAGRSLRDGLASGSDPGVADLFLLDAEWAMHQGRFREAVLFSWSTIDSVFNQKYDALVGVALAGELATARDFFTGVDFGLI